MNELTLYMLRVSLGITLISLSYILFFRSDSNLVAKRYFLLAGVIASWIFPLATINMPDAMDLFNNGSLEPAIYQPLSGVHILPDTNEAGRDIPYGRIALITIYLTGVIVLIVKDINLILTWRKEKRLCSTTGDKVIYTESNQVFTLFTWIFMPGKLMNEPFAESVLKHERAHIRQLHMIDLIIIELTIIVTWFNPFTWLISRMIKENHEHLADREVVSGGVNPAHYKAQLLNFSFGENMFRLGHQFNHSITKTRLKMMTETKNFREGIGRYILVVPIVMLTVLLAVSTKGQDLSRRIAGKVGFDENGKPAVGASVIIRGTTTGTVANIDGDYSLETSGRDDIIVISYVGYETVKISAREADGKTVLLKPTSYILDPGKAASGETKAEESNAITEKKQPEMAEEEIFIVVEDMPAFPGGMQALSSYISDNITYPDAGKGAGAVVDVTFTVMEDGSLREIGVAGSSNPAFNKAAVNLFRGMPKWDPGRQRGKAVKVKLVVPVRFDPGTE